MIKNKLEISKLVKQGGRIVGYELSDGHQVDKYSAIEMTKTGELSNVTLINNFDGSVGLATYDKNLKDLPIVVVHS